MEYFNATVLAKIAEETTGCYRSPSQFLYLSSTRKLFAKISTNLGLPQDKLFYKERGSDHSKWGIYLHNEFLEDFTTWLSSAGIEPREAEIRAKYLADNLGAKEIREGILTKSEFIKISNAKNWAKAIGEVLVISKIHNCSPVIKFYGVMPRALANHIESLCKQQKINFYWD